MGYKVCYCGLIKQKPTTLANGSIICSRCDLPINFENLEKEQPNRAESEANKREKFSNRPEAERSKIQSEIGFEAAERTQKYATLFENIGNVLQLLNAIAAVILLIAGLFFSGPGIMKFIYWVVILIIWAFSYLQTALIRGIASYFQMRVSDYFLQHRK